MRRLTWLPAAALALAVGCAGDDAAGTADTATAGDSAGADDAVAPTDAPNDASVDVGTPDDTATPDNLEAPPDDDAPADDVGADPGDTSDVAAPPALTLEVQAPIAPKANPLPPEGPESCAVIDDERCVKSVREVCAIYDPAAQLFVNAPDATLRRAFLYDRWYERYSAPDGQTADRVFTSPIAAGTPESEWGAPSHFAGWDGVGDSAIWSGTGLTAFALRYAETGTLADKARLETKTRQVLAQFEVTGIPGYLARYHFLRVPEGTPNTPDHILRTTADSYDYKDHAADPGALVAGDFPPEYTQGLPGNVPTEPMWHGNPSIDQYTGPRVGLLLAWALLDDASIKGRIATQLTCYLKRLQRVEVRNLQKNPDALKAFQGLLGGGTFTLDEGDIDPSTIDTLVAYGLPQPNTKNTDTFDSSCPDHVATEPTRVIDASADDFLLQLIALAGDLRSGDTESATSIDHMYANVRGGDAMHLLGMAATAYLMTGDEQYKTFADQVLLDQMQVLAFAGTTGALALPPWCTSFYGHHITYTPAWALFRTLAPGPVRDAIAHVFETELYGKLLKGHRNAKFDLMWSADVAPSIGVDAQALAADAAVQVRSLGGNGGVIDDPRRTYTLTPADAIAALPEGVTVRCPTEEERSQCESGFEVLGIPIPGEDITGTCKGKVDECVMADGSCATAIASSGLPSPLRVWQDFLWQRDPFELGHDFGGGAGAKQAPGLDFTESYWLARTLGVITEGKGQVLAWHVGGACSDGSD